MTPDDLPDGSFDDTPPLIPEPDYDEPIYQSKTLERKKKKSVSFLEDISKKEETTVKKINSNKKPESILKSGETCQHGKPILRYLTNADKYVQPIEKIPRVQAPAPVQKIPVKPEDKIRIEVKKSTSFSKKGISENDILSAKSALKPSRSFPNELNDNDNSSSGVSSDQDGQQQKSSSTKYVTYLPVETSTPITKKTYDSESSETSESNEKIVTMKKMLHPKLQAIFDLPPNQNYSSQTLPNKTKLKKALSHNEINKEQQH